MKAKFLLVFIIVLCSCARKSDLTDQGLAELIDLFSQPKSEMNKLSDIASEINFIPLQTTENSLVGSITKIITRNGKIYLKNSIDEILCFDGKGQFLYSLMKTGRGPGEYQYITDFDVSSDNNILLVLSGGKILIYIDNGTEFKFEKSINLNPPQPSMLSMIPGTSNILLSIGSLRGNEASLSILINIEGDTLNLKPNYYKYEKTAKFTRMLPYESQYSVEDKVCFKEESSDTVFYVNKESGKFIPWLILDSHGKGYSPQVKFDLEYAKTHGNEIYRVYSIIESPRFVIYSFEHNKARHKVLYDKSSNNKFKIAQQDAWQDDIIGGPLFNPDFCSEGKIYSIVEALTLKNYVTSEDFQNKRVINPEEKDLLKQLANSLKETDNPILFVLTTKN